MGQVCACKKKKKKKSIFYTSGFHAIVRIQVDTSTTPTFWGQATRAIDLA